MELTNSFEVTRSIDETWAVLTDVERIVASAGVDVAVNRKSTTWRGLPEAEREMAGPDDAVDLIMRHPALLKRPVIDFDGTIIVGFGPAQQAELAAKLA